jgi:TRAP-type C4-dicarboxylate transport system substrate-binding protein
MNFFSNVRKMALLSLAGVMFLSLVLVAQPAFAVTKVRMQSVFPASSKVTVFMSERYAPAVKERTNGEIDIKVFAAGALAKPLEVFDSVSMGVIDMAAGTGAYNIRKVPEALVEFGLPYSFTGPNFDPKASNQYYDFFNEYKDGAAGKILKDAYKKHKIHFIGVGASTGYGIMTNFPVKTLDDLKGKKIRSFGLFSPWIKKMGGAPVSIPSAEQYLALQRGTIDGSIYVYYALENYKLKEVVSHVVYPSTMAVVGINCFANQRFWDKLSPKNQKIIQETYVEMIKQYTLESLEYEKDSVEKAKEAGVKEVTLSDSDIAKMKESSRSLWPAAAKKSEQSAELVKLLKEYISEKEK